MAIWVPAGCSDGAPDGAEVEVTDSAGVSIVRSISADLPLILHSEVVLELGGKETAEESFYAVGSSNVGTDGSGNLYVLDQVAHRVQVFDSAGAHLRTMGGQGGGPGEIQFPFALAVAEDGRVWVADVGKHALVHWAPDGEILSQGPMPEGYFGGSLRWTRAGFAFLMQGAEGSHMALVRESGEPEVLASLPATETRAIQIPSCGISFSGMPPIFAANPVWTASGTRVVVAKDPVYVVDVFADGRLVRSVRRDLPPRPASVELAVASLGDGMRVRTQGGDRVCDSNEVVEQRGFSPYLPMVGALALSPDGTLWVQRYTVGSDPGPIDIFDADGHYLGTLPEGSPFPIGFLPDGRILVSETDALDLQRLVVRTVEFEGP